jgi:SAM-dependent methyltransferase
MSDQEKLEALATYFDLMTMNGGMQVYHASRRLGILDATGEYPHSAQQVAKTCGLRQEPVQLLLEVLCGLRLLRKEGDTYIQTPVTQFLARQYQNLGNEYWDYLPRFLESNIPLAAMDTPEQSEAQYQTQVGALAWMMQPAAEQAARLLGAGTVRRDLNIIDIGAGAAVWSLSIAAHDTHARITAVDWPAILEIATAEAYHRGLADRFATLPGNYHDIELPVGRFDLAIVGNVTHIETEAGNRALFQKLHRALKSGGELAVFDVMPGQERGDLARTLYALGLAMRTENGRVYPREELEGLLADTGFRVQMFRPLEIPPFTMGMILASKGGR